MDIVTVLGKDILREPDYRNKTIGQVIKMIKGLFENSCGYSDGYKDKYDHQNVQIFKETQTLLLELNEITPEQCKRM